MAGVAGGGSRGAAGRQKAPEDPYQDQRHYPRAQHRVLRPRILRHRTNEEAAYGHHAEIGHGEIADDPATHLRRDCRLNDGVCHGRLRHHAETRDHYEYHGQRKPGRIGEQDQPHAEDYRVHPKDLLPVDFSTCVGRCQEEGAADGPHADEAVDQTKCSCIAVKDIFCIYR